MLSQHAGSIISNKVGPKCLPDRFIERKGVKVIFQLISSSIDTFRSLFHLSSLLAIYSHPIALRLSSRERQFEKDCQRIFDRMKKSQFLVLALAHTVPFDYRERDGTTIRVWKNVNAQRS
jgi:hypothetical protein